MNAPFHTFGSPKGRALEERWRNLCVVYLNALFDGASENRIRAAAQAVLDAGYEMRKAMRTGEAP